MDRSWSTCAGAIELVLSDITEQHVDVVVHPSAADLEQGRDALNTLLG
jgi:hypothetical protein